jgi:DNA-binding LacI/PurR family transcriptional regulator
MLQYPDMLQYCQPLIATFWPLAFLIPENLSCPLPVFTLPIGIPLPQTPLLAIVEPSTNLVATGQQPAHRRIFEGLRSQILTGKFVPGTQLPGARDLATAWQTSTFTIHTALQSLAREGWIDRRPNAGTYIADPRNRFLCAGIYQGGNITLDTNTSFARNLHFSLLNQLDRSGKKTQVFIDSRPKDKQDKILPGLDEALQQRRIQCVIAPSTNPFDQRYPARLPVPTSFLGNPFSPNRVEFDLKNLFRESLRRLTSQGCRSVGLISQVSWNRDEKDDELGFYSIFRDVLKETSLVTRKEWVRCPAKHFPDFEFLGYREFKALWNLRHKPDGIIVYSDTAARGVITAILETGIHVVPRQMKFVFHRNAHVRLLCPFPVTWAISDEDKVAQTLIQLIQRQFNGEKNSPVLLPYTFKAGPAKS